MLAEARHQMMALERLEKARHADHAELENQTGDQALETSKPSASLVGCEAAKTRLRAPSVFDLWRCLACLGCFVHSAVPGQ